MDDDSAITDTVHYNNWPNDKGVRENAVDAVLQLNYTILIPAS